MCTYYFYRWCHDQFNKNTDGEYLKEMKTFKQINLTPNKRGYTLERHPTKKQKVGKTELNYDINSGKTGESFVFKESKSKFKFLPKLTILQRPSWPIFKIVLVLEYLVLF